MQSPRGITLFFLLLLLGVATLIYLPRHWAQQKQTAELSSLLSGLNKSLVLPSRTKTANCASNGALPDHSCTPGAVFSAVTLEQICAAGYSANVRNVSQKLRKAVFAEYGVPYPQPRGAFEVDHLIPLALGGSNGIANLFLEPAEPAPGFREKDLVENYLHSEVCSGRVALNVAQEQIASDWLAIYNKLSPDQIEALKARFKNWSQ